MGQSLENIKIKYKNSYAVDTDDTKALSCFFNDVIESSLEKKIVTLMLHSGASMYNAIVVAKAAILCLIYENSDVEELLSSLVPGDIMILEGKRVQFLGIDTGKNLGIPMPNFHNERYVCYRANDGICQIPIKRLINKNIYKYQGGSTNLTGKGIKSGFEKRKEFISFMLGEEKKNVSSEVFHSIAVICDREQAEDIYRNTSIEFEGKTIFLSELMTAAFYSDNDSMQLGKNPTKEEPIIKFYSKISSLKSDLENDERKRVVGCIACNELLWTGNADMHKISENGKIDYCVLLGRTHYTRYFSWLEKTDNKCFALLPRVHKEIFTSESKTKRMLNREIMQEIFDSPVDDKIMIGLKKKLLYVKENLPESDEKEEFLLNSYSIINLCRSAYFPLRYYDLMANNGQIPVLKLSEKFGNMDKIKSKVFGTCKEYVNSIISILEKLVTSIYDVNLKAEYLREKVRTSNVDVIVTTKAYHESIFTKWLEDTIKEENFSVPKILTVSAYSKSKEIYNNVYFSTVYQEFKFNLYADLGFKTGIVLRYPYEQSYFNSLSIFAKRGETLLLNKCGYDYTIDDCEIASDDTILDTTYEDELEEFTKGLQIEHARKYLNKNECNKDDGVKVKAIISFVSGEIGYFTEQFKAYCLTDSGLEEIELENLNPGDSIVFTKVSENKDIVDLIFNKLLETSFSGTKIELSYAITCLWKAKLEYFLAKNNMSYYDFSKLLEKYGCKKHHVTIRSWLYEESHVVGPRDPDDYKAILKAIKSDEELNYIEVSQAAELVRKTRTRILGILGKVIARNVIEQDEEDPIWKEISYKADSLSQVEQIRDIKFIKEEMRLPLNMVNKPIVI